MNRIDGRAFDELCPVKITTDFIKFAEGSCLIECGDTKVLCCASVENRRNSENVMKCTPFAEW